MSNLNITQQVGERERERERKKLKRGKETSKCSLRRMRSQAAII